MRNTNWWQPLATWLGRTAVCGALLLSATGVPAARAQEAAPAAPAAAAPAVKKFTNEELKTVLENLGYEPEADLNGDKINLLILQWKQGTFQFIVYISVSGDGENLIVQAPLKSLPADDAAYGKELSGILAKGFVLTPSHFVVDDSRMLRLIRFVPNQGLTPAKIRKSLSEFTDQVRNSESVWRCDRWEAKSTIVAKPVVVAPQLEGNWKITTLSSGGVAHTKESLDARQVSLTIAGDKLIFSENGAAAPSITIRAGDTDTGLDIVHAADKIEKALFSRDGNKARFAFAPTGAERPTDFTGKPGVTVVEMELVAK